MVVIPMRATISKRSEIGIIKCGVMSFKRNPIPITKIRIPTLVAKLPVNKNLLNFLINGIL